MMVNVDEWLGYFGALRIGGFPGTQSRPHGNQDRFEKISAGNVAHCLTPSNGADLKQATATCQRAAEGAQHSPELTLY
jgi:hypothetical protein